MKYVYMIVIAMSFLNCKNDKTVSPIIFDEEVKTQDKLDLTDTIKLNDGDLEPLSKSISIEIKQEEFREKSDDEDELQELIIEKTYFVEQDGYKINFRYPQLNESIDKKHRSFNEFINDHYVNIAKTKSDIFDSQLFCDSIGSTKFREERFIDYKIYNLNDEILSVLFYKENFYSGAMFPSYSFNGFNYNLNTGVFMRFNDFFVNGSEEAMVEVINKTINNKIAKGDMYYECWELSQDDFIKAKNNFVINDDNVEFYFDDCVICPSYTGTYSIEIGLLELMPILKKFDANPLLL